MSAKDQQEKIGSKERGGRRIARPEVAALILLHGEVAEHRGHIKTLVQKARNARVAAQLGNLRKIVEEELAAAGIEIKEQPERHTSRHAENGESATEPRQTTTRKVPGAIRAQYEDVLVALAETFGVGTDSFENAEQMAMEFSRRERGNGDGDLGPKARIALEAVGGMKPEHIEDAGTYIRIGTNGYRSVKGAYNWPQNSESVISWANANGIPDSDIETVLCKMSIQYAYVVAEVCDELIPDTAKNKPALVQSGSQALGCAMWEFNPSSPGDDFESHARRIVAGRIRAKLNGKIPTQAERQPQYQRPNTPVDTTHLNETDARLVAWAATREIYGTPFAIRGNLIRTEMKYVRSLSTELAAGDDGELESRLTTTGFFILKSLVRTFNPGDDQTTFYDYARPHYDRGMRLVAEGKIEVEDEIKFDALLKLLAIQLDSERDDASAPTANAEEEGAVVSTEGADEDEQNDGQPEEEGAVVSTEGADEDEQNDGQPEEEGAVVSTEGADEDEQNDGQPEEEGAVVSTEGADEDEQNDGQPEEEGAVVSTEGADEDGQPEDAAAVVRASVEEEDTVPAADEPGANGQPEDARDEEETEEDETEEDEEETEEDETEEEEDETEEELNGAAQQRRFSDWAWNDHEVMTGSFESDVTSVAKKLESTAAGIASSATKVPRLKPRRSAAIKEAKRLLPKVLAEYDPEDPQYHHVAQFLQTRIGAALDDFLK